MPGAEISGLLASHSYEAFYQLAHSYSEHLLGKAAGIKMTCDMIARLENTLSNNIFLSPTETARFQENVLCLKTQGKELQEATRACFWPHVAAQIMSSALSEEAHQLDEAFNRERWQPYDGEAWDKFFTGVVEHLKPRIVAFKQFIESVTMPDGLTNAMIADTALNNQIVFIRDFKKNLYPYISGLETLLDPDEVEALYS